MYDSTQDTEDHINKVQQGLGVFIRALDTRGRVHDASKLQEPEKSLFDKYTPLLRETTYGSDEYKQHLKDMGAALTHHYEVNSHHPEHYEWGLHDMSLLDIVEMFCDWKAASQRHANGNMVDSLEINRKRFDVEDQLHNIFKNTVKELGW